MQKQVDVLFVCSAGGHLAQLIQLKPWYEKYNRSWVTDNTITTRSMLKGESLIKGNFPVTRNIPNLIRNTILAWKVLKENKPKIIISNGAAIAVPFFFLAKLFRIPTMYIEVYDRIDSKTLTGRIIEPVTTTFCVQWPEQLEVYPQATLVGSVY